MKVLCPLLIFIRFIDSFELAPAIGDKFTIEPEENHQIFQRKAEEFRYDLSDYSVRFGKCQYVKMFDDEIAQDMDASTVLALKHFVVYRMCPSDECSSCEFNYGEYVVEVDEYLQNIAEYYKESFEYQCEMCEENDYKCNNNDEGWCVCNDCDRYQNMEDNGIIDATEFIECQKLELNNGGDDDEEDDATTSSTADDITSDLNDLELYVGPRCTSDGQRIAIDVFQDENCWEPYSLPDGVSLENLLGYKLSYYFLRSVYSRDPNDCISCSEQNQQDVEDEEDKEDKDDVFEVCENLYDRSAKCETKHGFYDGLISDNSDEYENQMYNEYAVCNFIDSLVWNSYDEKGEINVGVPQDVIIRYVTPLQAGMLSLLSMSAFGLLCLVYYTYLKVESVQPNLESRGGTMT